MPRPRTSKSKARKQTQAITPPVPDNALACDKKAYFESRVRYWQQRLLIDPKFHVELQYQTSPRYGEDQEEKMTESLKLEEMTISTLERVLLGPERYATILEILTGESGCWADCECEQGHYLWFKITYYRDLLQFEGEEFAIMADRCALHEMLHVFLWPLVSYTEHLQH